MKINNQESKKLYELYYDLAKDRKWQRKPFNASDIDDLTQYYYETSISFAPVMANGKQKNLRAACGAIELLVASICGPNDGDPKIWFFESLYILSSIAKPTTSVDSPEALEYLEILETGIKQLRN